MSISQNYPTTNPSLSLDFANTKVLDPRITFSRPTSAVYYDGQTVTKAEENLVLQSQTFDVSWLVSGASRTANSTTAPDGTNTADKLIEDSSTAVHAVYQAKTVIATTHTASVYMKASERSWGFLQFSTGQLGAYFDLTGGVVGTVSSGFTASIQSVNDGWYRCSITTTTTSASWTFAVLTATGDGVISYTGDGTSGIFIWGAQLEQRDTATAYQPTTTQPITNYIPTLLTVPANSARFDHDPVTGESLGLLIEEQRTNLVTYSEDFSNGAWLKSKATVTSNIVVAPDGTLTGDKIVENTESGMHNCYRSVSLTSGTSYTWSAYFKAGERSWAIIDANTGSQYYTFFNLTNGTVGTNPAGSTATITPVGNGWYKCTVSRIATSGTHYMTILCGLSDNVVTYTGDGYSGIYIWGAQLEAGAFPTSYIPTVASQVTRSADSASMTGANFSSWYRADEGTLYTDFAPVGVGTAGWYYWFSLNLSATNTIAIRQYATGTNNYRIDYNGSAQATNDVGASLANVYKKIGLVYKFNDIASVYDGSNLTVDSTANIPDVTRFDIGGSFGVALKTSLYVKKISYFPARLSNEELQEMTS